MLWLESIPALLDFLLKLLFAEHISSVSLCHLSSLPQFSVREKCSLSPSQGPAAMRYEQTLSNPTRKVP